AFFAVDFRAALRAPFFAVDFLAVDFFAVDFFAVVLRAAFRAPLRAAALRALFFAAVFRAALRAPFLGVDFLSVVFFAAVLLDAALRAPFFAVVLRAALRAPFFAAVLRAPFFAVRLRPRLAGVAAVVSVASSVVGIISGMEVVAMVRSEDRGVAAVVPPELPPDCTIFPTAGAAFVLAGFLTAGASESRSITSSAESAS